MRRLAEWAFEARRSTPWGPDPFWGCRMACTKLKRGLSFVHAPRAAENRALSRPFLGPIVRDGSPPGGVLHDGAGGRRRLFAATARSLPTHSMGRACASRHLSSSAFSRWRTRGLRRGLALVGPERCGVPPDRAWPARAHRSSKMANPLDCSASVANAAVAGSHRRHVALRRPFPIGSHLARASAGHIAAPHALGGGNGRALARRAPPRARTSARPRPGRPLGPSALRANPRSARRTTALVVSVLRARARPTGLVRRGFGGSRDRGTRTPRRSAGRRSRRPGHASPTGRGAP